MRGGTSAGAGEWGLQRNPGPSLPFIGTGECRVRVLRTPRMSACEARRPSQAGAFFRRRTAGVVRPQATWDRLVTMRLRLAVVFALLALVVGVGVADAATRHRYAGLVHFSTGHARLHFTVHDDSYVDEVGSGRIPLDCNRGSRTVRIRTGAIPMDDAGRVFGVRFDEVGLAPGNSRPLFRAWFRFGGKLSGDQAHARGSFKYSIRFRSGRHCSTGGRLQWTARMR
jgi:hypothetical protein